jgi:hypothetical protein
MRCSGIYITICSRESGFFNGGPPQQETYTHVDLHLQETSTSVFSISYTTIAIRHLILQSLNLAFDAKESDGALTRWSDFGGAKIGKRRQPTFQGSDKISSHPSTLGLGHHITIMTTLASQPQPSAFRPSNIQDGPSVALFRSAEHTAAPQLKRTFGSLDSVIDDQQ